MSLKSFASYFVAYLLDHLKNQEIILRVTLFGSVARGEATGESDIDFFIEVKKKTRALEEEIEKIKQQFYQSREAALFKARGIDNPISIKIGQSNDWEYLSRSIASTGIILYGPYEVAKRPKGTRHYLLIFWEKISKNRGAFLNKVYGVTIKKKHYLGILGKYQGRKIGKSSIMLPIEYKKEIFRLIKEHYVEAKIIEIFS